MPEPMKTFKEQFQKVFGEGDELFPELSLKTLELFNTLEFNKRRNYDQEHRNRREIKKEEISGKIK
jgi:hypothetical protein